MEDLWHSAALVGLEYEIVSSLVNPDKAQVRYRIKLQSAFAGKLERETWVDLVREGEAWRVRWAETTLLPELGPQNGLLLAPVIPTRANIYDRQGLALAAPAEIVALWIVPNQIGDEDAEEAMLSALSRLLDRPPEAILALYDDLRGTDWFVHLGEVALEEFQPFQDTLAAVGGVNWRIYSGRYYLKGGLAPHATGYVSWIPEDQLDDYLMRGYLRDEFVGQRGVEKAFEEHLRGVPGGTLYLTDAEGNPTKPLASRDPQPPNAVYTTLDRELQLHVQQALSGFNGAIVVLERDTGAVLAIASSPTFDPNLFNPNHPYSGAGLSEIFSDPSRPLFDRATRGTYPLGSVFKLITMAAALESGFYQPDTTYNCGSTFTELPGITLYDWTYERELPPQGEITLRQALERSCNPYFYHIGLDLYQQGMPTALPDMARAFGLGQPTGLEIGDEAGLVPSPESKEARFGEPWGPQDAVNLAIGQSFLQATPLQAARYVAAIGNGGILYRPQIVDRIQSPAGEIVHQFAPDPLGQLPVSQENLEAIQEAMVAVVRAQKGTARKRFLGLNLNIAGKTGTATTGDFSEPHAWFVGYTFEGREDKPDIAVAVLVEFAGEGSEWAAPIFRRVIESYFFGRPIALYPWEARIGVAKTPTPTPTPEGAAPQETATPEP
jgi:penicillin-binding protein 2